MGHCDGLLHQYSYYASATLLQSRAKREEIEIDVPGQPPRSWGLCLRIRDPWLTLDRLLQWPYLHPHQFCFLFTSGPGTGFVDLAKIVTRH